MRSGSLISPRPLEAFDCGSQSMRRVLTSAAANDAAKLIAVVVLPTPPFWLATAMTRPIGLLEKRELCAEYVEAICDCNDGIQCKLCRAHSSSFQINCARFPNTFQQRARKRRNVPRGTLVNMQVGV